MKVHSGAVLFDEIDGIERHECYAYDPLLKAASSQAVNFIPAVILNQWETR